MDGFMNELMDGKRFGLMGIGLVDFESAALIGLLDDGVLEWIKTMKISLNIE